VFISLNLLWLLPNVRIFLLLVLSPSKPWNISLRWNNNNGLLLFRCRMLLGARCSILQRKSETFSFSNVWNIIYKLFGLIFWIRNRRRFWMLGRFWRGSTCRFGDWFVDQIRAFSILWSIFTLLKGKLLKGRSRIFIFLIGSVMTIKGSIWREWNFSFIIGSLGLWFVELLFRMLVVCWFKATKTRFFWCFSHESKPNCEFWQIKWNL